MCVLRTLAGTLALIGAAVSAGQPLAAEIKQQPSFNLPLTSAPAVVSRPVELGTGWYFRGQLGFGQDSETAVISGFKTGQETRQLGGLGFGYKQNNWMRYDLTVDYNRQQSARKAGAMVVCPYGLTVVQNKTTNIKFGYFWDETRDTCTSMAVGTLQKADFLGNFYIDLGTWSRVTPYVGVGLGISALRTRGGIEYRRTSTGQLYNTDLRPSADSDAPHIWVNAQGGPVTSWVDATGQVQDGNPPVAFDQQNWSRIGGSVKFNPAFALLAGVSFDISEQLKGEVAWRYLNSGSLKSLSSTLAPESVSSQLNSQQITLGFRYMID
jgi:opacity protein-like surface antigen